MFALAPPPICTWSPCPPYIPPSCTPSCQIINDISKAQKDISAAQARQQQLRSQVEAAKQGKEDSVRRQGRGLVGVLLWQLVMQAQAQTIPDLSDMRGSQLHTGMRTEQSFLDGVSVPHVHGQLVAHGCVCCDMPCTDTHTLLWLHRCAYCNSFSVLALLTLHFPLYCRTSGRSSWSS